MKIVQTNLKQLLYIRPHELNDYITKIKILNKYNRLSPTELKNHETFFTKVFEETPYPFTWNLYYDKKEHNEPSQLIRDQFLSIEKKILFEHFTVNNKNN